MEQQLSELEAASTGKLKMVLTVALHYMKVRTLKPSVPWQRRHETLRENELSIESRNSKWSKDRRCASLTFCLRAMKALAYSIWCEITELSVQ